MNINGKLRELGFSPAESMGGVIEAWRAWYIGSVEDFHNYSVWNGTKNVMCRRYSAGMPKKVCEDWANLLLNEKVSVTVDGQKEQEFIDSVLEENNFRVKGNEMQEWKAALGTAAYVLRAEGAQVDTANGDISGASQIRIDYCTAGAIHPLSWSNGRVQECAFSTEFAREKKRNVYLQIHHLVGGLYDIENKMFEDGEEVSLSSVSGFENVPATVHTNSDKPQFVVDRLNIANPDANSPMGVSVFANAIDQIKGVDIAYDSYINEFILGKKRIMVQPEATKHLDGRDVFDPNDTVYYVLPEDVAGRVLIQQVDMTLRTQEHNSGVQDMLNMLSSKCGFGENHYRYDRGSISTATQIVSENSTLFRTLKKHEIILEEVLITLCRTILRMGNAYMGLSLNEEANITVRFDDSIIEDKQSDFNRDMQLLNAGIMNDWEFRAKWMNEDEKTARESLPGMEQMTDEGQDELE